jgi:hypothetical protein
VFGSSTEDVLFEQPLTVSMWTIVILEFVCEGAYEVTLYIGVLKYFIDLISILKIVESKYSAGSLNMCL